MNKEWQKLNFLLWITIECNMHLKGLARFPMSQICPGVTSYIPCPTKFCDGSSFQTKASLPVLVSLCNQQSMGYLLHWFKEQLVCTAASCSQSSLSVHHIQNIPLSVDIIIGMGFWRENSLLVGAAIWADLPPPSSGNSYTLYYLHFMRRPS